MIRIESAVDLISLLNETDETSEIEAKSIGMSKVGHSVYETINSLSNEPNLGGGTILLGLEKEELLFPLYSATGVEDPDKVTNDIATGCSGMFNLPIRPKISSERVDGKVIVRVDVSELPSHQKPLYFNKHGLQHGVFRRIGSADIKCTDDDLFSLMQNRAKESHDAQLVDETSLDDLDETAISSYRRLRKQANPQAEELGWSDEDMLFALGAIKKLDTTFKLTVMGVLCFGKSSSIRRIFPSHRVDYIRVPGTKWMANPDDNLGGVDMRGPLMTLAARLFAAIFDDLPKTFKITENLDGFREEIPILPFRVIRESVVNALMHRSYQIYQPIQMLRYANRIEIRNPGYSLKSQDRFEETGSNIRNPLIAEIMRETRLAETKGSGIRVMRQKMVESGLTPPAFDSDREKDEFASIFLFHHFLNASDLEWLAGFQKFELSENQNRVLIFVRELGAIDNSVFRDFSGCDNQIASRELRKMKQLDLLSVKGQGTRTYYIEGPEMKKIMGGGSHDSDGSSHDLKKTVQVSDLPQNLRAKLTTALLPKQIPHVKAESLIVEMCDWRELSAFEISHLLNKKQNYVSQSYLAPMIKSGKLTYKYPEMVNHPEQKYCSKPIEG